MMSLCVKCIQAISTVWHVHQSLATVKREFTGTDVMLIIDSSNLTQQTLI